MAPFDSIQELTIKLLAPENIEEVIKIHHGSIIPGNRKLGPEIFPLSSVKIEKLHGFVFVQSKLWSGQVDVLVASLVEATCHEHSFHQRVAFLKFYASAVVRSFLSHLHFALHFLGF